MNIDYFLNAMIEKIDFAILDSYLLKDKKGKKKSSN